LFFRSEESPSLLKLQGRPSEPSPKARFLSLLGTPLPFDRHDWTIDRQSERVRYVLDYYEGPDDLEGNPSFIVDVRPALDSFGSAWDRVKMW